MRKTLLLVFIHGFKGGDDTFGTFPEHVRALVSHALPEINVLAVQYPQFETRGELKECVARLREWLENKVIDLEVANSTPSPTIDPSVHTVLMGHSMGGIVAAELLLLLASERPLDNNSVQNDRSSKPEPSTRPASPVLMFPHVQAVVAFDTPYLGLAPEMVAHSLEGSHKVATSAWETANEWASVFGYGSKASTGAPATANTTVKSAGALPAPVKDATADAAAAPKWQSWGKYAMFAGAAGAVAAGGAAALYSQREKISAGWNWATSHLLFVGDLAKAEVLRKRVESMERCVAERGLGSCTNFYTNLGRGAREGYGITDQFAGRERTFCNLPRTVKEKSITHDNANSATSGKEERGKLRWVKAVNDKAKDETSAHMSMFFPRDNPGFYLLAERAVEILGDAVDRRWYESSSGPDTTGHVSSGPDAKLSSSFGQSIDDDHSSHEGASADKFGTSIGKDWEGVETKDTNAWASGGEAEDVEMREHDKENRDELEDSVIIENMRASTGVAKQDAAQRNTDDEKDKTLASA